MKTWSQHLYHFYTRFDPPRELPNGMEWLFPQERPEVQQVVKAFLDKYFNDRNERRLLLGINPGRFGAGVTGVNFTAPRQLSEVLGIAHPFKMQSEISAEFIYDMIAAYGGPEAFYHKHFIGSVCPLGFVQQGKNINYYDDRQLLATVEPFIIGSIEEQLRLPVDRSVCAVIGGEKNFRYLSKLNARFGWFEKLEPLPHPRFIMQYKRKEKERFIEQYLEVLAR